jgi:hypothetical protein
MIAPSRHIDFDVEDEEMQIDTWSGSVAVFTQEEEAEAVKISNFKKEWALIVLMGECCTVTNN